MMRGSTKDSYVFTATYDADNRMTSLEYIDSSSGLHRQEFCYSGDDVLTKQMLYENGTLVKTARIVRDGILAIQDRNAGAVMVQYEYRNYLPDIGRWTTRDPFGRGWWPEPVCVRGGIIRSIS